MMPKCLIFCLGIFLLIGGCKPRNANNVVFPGYLEGEFVYISSPFGGIVKKIYVKRGDVVKGKQILFELDSTQKKSELNFYNNALQASLSIVEDMRKCKREPYIREAESSIGSSNALKEWYYLNNKRYSYLSNVKAQSEQEYEKYKYNYRMYTYELEKAKAKLDETKLPSRPDRINAVVAASNALRDKILGADWDLSQMVQYAPSAAFVFDTVYREGEFASSGSPVVILLPPENVKARFFVSGEFLNKLKIGETVHISVLGKKSFPGKIDYISPKVEYTPPVIYSEQNQQKLVYLIEASIPSDIAKTLPVGEPIQVHE